MIQLKLETFDGPLDLLLHLIKIHEVDIFNIPIVLITHQYLSYLSQVKDLDFQQAGEYLAMASQLVEIKAKMLIPILQNKPIQEEVEGEESGSADPRKNLIAQLLEYQMIKGLASQFAIKNEEFHNTFISGEPQRRADEFESYAKVGHFFGNPLDLLIAYERAILKFQKDQKDPKVKVLKQKITIQERMERLLEELDFSGTLMFFDLLWRCQSRYEAIILILAILELAKEKCFDLVQEKPLGDILLLKKNKVSTDLEVSGLQETLLS